MSEEVVIEEENVLIRAISTTESVTILILVYWIMLAVLIMYGKIDQDSFEKLILAGPIVTYLLRKIGYNPGR